MAKKVLFMHYINMRINTINLTDNGVFLKYRNKNTKSGYVCSKSERYPGLQYVNFHGVIPPSGRLKQSNYLISGYIKEIGKARDFHGVRSVVDLSMGNPDLTPPEKAKEMLKLKVNDLWSHRYNNPKGEGVLFHTVSDWAKERFGITVDPRKEVMATSGSSDAIDHIFTAFANEGDKILIPNPGYSLYDDLITRHDLKKVPYDLYQNNNYQPDFSKMQEDAKIIILNYPHNPTGVFADMETLENAVEWAKRTNTLIIHDMDNSEITQSGIKPNCIMQVDGAKDVAFQIHTFSKAQSMPGFRVAFAISDQENISNLLKAKFLSGGSVYVPVQHAAAEALKDEEGYIDKVNKIYRERKNKTVDWINKLGGNTKPSEGTYYLWVKIPPEFSSDEFFKYVLHKAQVAFTPGTVFGTNGEGYVRMVMSAPTETIDKCFKRLENANIRFDVPKSKLPEDVRKQIQEMSDNSYFMESKADRDFKEYMKVLQTRKNILESRFQNLDSKFNRFIPKDGISLPWNILKDGQGVYLQDVHAGMPVFGDVKDIPPFSGKEDYELIAAELKSQWNDKSYPNADILPPYKSQTLYNDAYYVTLKTEDGKLQALANLELQDDGIMWVRTLNTAPWNQGRDGQIRGCGKAILARMVTICLETGNDTLKLATFKPENVKFYKSLGFKEDGIRNCGGVINTVLTMNKPEMATFLDKYQVNLAF